MKIDHIVYAVPDFEEALTNLQHSLGIRPQFGGYHESKGTKNALVNLGDQCYLEILAVDEDNSNVHPPRWMGVDVIKAPKITRWSLKSMDIKGESEILKAYQVEMGKKKAGKRKTASGDFLTWEMLMPLATPEVELVPFFTDWRTSAHHPTDTLVEKCTLVDLQFTHPNPSSIQAVFDELKLNYTIQKGEDIQIRMRLNTPNGEVVI